MTARLAVLLIARAATMLMLGAILLYESNALPGNCPAQTDCRD